MNDRTFIEEAKAMERTIKGLYIERDYLEKEVKEHHRSTDKIRLQMVNHFIGVYERG